MSEEIEELKAKVRDLNHKVWAMQLDMNQLRKALAHSITGIGLVNQIAQDTSILIATPRTDEQKVGEILSRLKENGDRLKDNMAMATAIAWGEHNGGWVFGDEK